MNGWGDIDRRRKGVTCHMFNFFEEKTPHAASLMSSS